LEAINVEFRWLTTEERRGHSVESSSLSEVLALAQKLQADGEGRVSEDQAVEMGRELGVRPEYIREALRLRSRSSQAARGFQPEPTLPPTDHNPIASVAQVLLLVFALGMLPRALEALERSHVTPQLFLLFTIMATMLAGWSARYSRLAGVAGALAIPILLLVAAFYPTYNPGLAFDAIFFSLISLCPLGSALGRVAARARRFAERFVDRPRLTARG
jgi:hypothetical protein